MFNLQNVFLISMLSYSVLSVIVKVKEGCLEGEELQSEFDGSTYYSFKGVPYAKPPLNELRFKAPLPAEPWLGIRDAKNHGSKCVQYNLDEFRIIPASEDCLFLNVYTPNLNPENPLAVMFFIHGGNFMSGSGDEDYYGPDILVTFDVVVVTINYRLEVLGFLQLDIPEVPGNAGMKDQVAALKWVQKNIRSFGGDPNNVTIFGESAGGASVGLHMLSPLSKGLFNRAIAMSGVPFSEFSQPFEIKRKSFILGEQLGLKTEDPYELLDFLQNIPANKMVNVNTSAIITEDEINFLFKTAHFIPTTEINFGVDNFMTKDSLDALRTGQVNCVDYMSGFTNIEYLFLMPIFEEEFFSRYRNHTDMFAPTKILQSTTPKEILKAADSIYRYFFGNEKFTPKIMDRVIKYIKSIQFGYNTLRFLNYLPNTRKKYLYLFSCQSGRNVIGNEASAKYGLNGTVHTDDLNYLFQPKKYNLTFMPGSEGYVLVQRIASLFVNFAKYGNPTVEDLLWKQYGACDGAMSNLEIGNTFIPGFADATEYNFWKELYENAGVQF